MQSAIELIQEERIRQIEVEGFGTGGDDRYANGELVLAAACYTLIDWARKENPEIDYSIPPDEWPWSAKWWKPTPNIPIRELIKAGALIAAEIERLQRLEK